MGAHERFFVRATEEIVSIEDRYVLPGRALSLAVLDFSGDGISFGLGVVE